MRQVVDELQTSGFMTQDELQARVLPTSDPTVGDQLSGLSRRVGALERNFTDPNGTLARLETRVKGLEDRQTGESVEQGGMAFRDISAVSAWIQTFTDKTFTVTVLV